MLHIKGRNRLNCDATRFLSFLKCNNMHLLYISTRILVSILRKFFVKIFYCRNCIFMQSGSDKAHIVHAVFHIFLLRIRQMFCFTSPARVFQYGMSFSVWRTGVS